MAVEIPVASVIEVDRASLTDHSLKLTLVVRLTPLWWGAGGQLFLGRVKDLINTPRIVLWVV